MISRLCKIDDEVVFYSPTLASRGGLYAELSNGTKIAYDQSGNALSTDEAVKCLAIICDRQTGTNALEQIFANIQLWPTVVAIVREDLLQYPDGEGVFMKLAPIVGMLQVGLFYTASQTLQTFTPDEILTQERLDRWSAMLTSADAIV